MPAEIFTDRALHLLCKIKGDRADRRRMVAPKNLLTNKFIRFANMIKAILTSQTTSVIGYQNGTPFFMWRNKFNTINIDQSDVATIKIRQLNKVTHRELSTSYDNVLRILRRYRQALPALNVHPQPPLYSRKICTAWRARRSHRSQESEQKLPRRQRETRQPSR